MTLSERSNTEALRQQLAFDEPTIATRSASKSEVYGRRRNPVYICLGILLLGPFTLAAMLPGAIAPHDPFANVGPALLSPNLLFPFGTDDLGRDVFSGIVWGARTSLLIGGTATLLSLAIGLLIGVVAGYCGGWIDDCLMRTTEVVTLLPRFFVALLVVTLFGASLLNICLILGLLGWPGLARIARAETLVQRSREYVLASVAIGASAARIMFRHILPAVQQILISVAAPVMTAAILSEAGLAYLGLADPNWTSWGKIIQNGQAFHSHGWWLSVFPGLAITSTCVGVTILLEGLEPSAPA